MRNLNIQWAFALVFCGVAILLYFVLPAFRLRHADGGYWTTDTIYSYPTGTAEEQRTAIQDLLQRVKSLQEREYVKAIFAELTLKSTDQLFILKSETDPCADEQLIDCKGERSADVKPFIEAALAYRQSAGTEALAWQANLIAAASAGISLISMFVAIFLGLRHRKT